MTKHKPERKSKVGTQREEVDPAVTSIQTDYVRRPLALLHTKPL